MPITLYFFLNFGRSRIIPSNSRGRTRLTILAICPTASFWVGFGVVILTNQRKLMFRMYSKILKDLFIVNLNASFQVSRCEDYVEDECSVRYETHCDDYSERKYFHSIFLWFLISLSFCCFWLGVKKFPKEGARQATKINVKWRKNVTHFPRKSVGKFQRKSVEMFRYFIHFCFLCYQ